MKKLLPLVLALVFAVPALAQAPSPYLAAAQDGKYAGVIRSSHPGSHGKKPTLVLAHEAGQAVAHVTFDGRDETWRWDDKTLHQVETDHKTGKKLAEYGATAATPATASEQVYAVNCTDRAKNACDGKNDGRATWTLKVAPDAIDYIYTSVPDHQKADPKAKAVQRFDIQFVRVK